MDNTEGIDGNSVMRMVTFSDKNPFGTPGEDYSEEFTVTCTPLFAGHKETNWRGGVSRWKDGKLQFWNCDTHKWEDFNS